MPNHVLHVIWVFFNRHWLIGVENLVITAALGLGIVHLISCLGRGWVAPGKLLILKRAVLLFVLCKATFFFVVGIAFNGKGQFPFALGLQFPDLREILGVIPASAWDILRPTPLTQRLTEILLLYAFICLVRRTILFKRTSQAILRRSCDVPDDQKEYVESAMTQAAQIIGAPKLNRVPIFAGDSSLSASPFVLGVWRPRIVIRQDCLKYLIEKGWLVPVLCHELMHIVRGDQVVRWLQLWVEDVARPILFGNALGMSALQIEEQICDCGAIRSTPDAVALGQAIASMYNDFSGAPTQDPTSQTLPGFSCLIDKKSDDEKALETRLTEILRHTDFVLSKPKPKKIFSTSIKLIGIVFLGLLLFVALYLRYYFFWKA